VLRTSDASIALVAEREVRVAVECGRDGRVLRQGLRGLRMPIRAGEAREEVTAVQVERGVSVVFKRSSPPLYSHRSRAPCWSRIQSTGPPGCRRTTPSTASRAKRVLWTPQQTHSRSRTQPGRMGTC